MRPHALDSRVRRSRILVAVIPFVFQLVRLLNLALPSRGSLILENLALRQQLAVYNRSAKRPRLRQVDRLLWVRFSRCWSDWRSVVDIVRAKTVIGWHRQGVRRYWRGKSRQRGRKPGRPPVTGEVRELIRTMKQANPLWGAPRIQGELLKLGFEISERTISRLLSKTRQPPSQRWRETQNRWRMWSVGPIFLGPSAGKWPT